MMKRTAVCLAAAALVLPLAAGAARADVIYFKSGAEREVKTVLHERGGMLYYEALEGGNVVGIPLSAVARWERSVVEDKEDENKSSAETEPKGAAPAKPEKPEGQEEPPGEDEGHGTSRVFKPGDVPPMEKALLANPKNAALKRLLSRAYSQFAVEAQVANRESERSAHMARAKALAPTDKTVALIEEVHALVKEERHDEAEKSLRMARDAAEKDYRLLLLDGELAYERGDLKDAFAAWEEALKMNPTFEELAAAVSQIKTEIAAQEGFESGASRHFAFEFDEAVDDETAREISAILEEAYEKITNALNHYPRRPITVLIYAKADFEAVTGVPVDWVEGLFDGKIRIPLKALMRNRDRLRATLAHETAHAVIHAKARGNAGRWIHEGLAQRFEESRDAGRYAESYLRAYESAGERVPLPSDYPSAHLWVEYLSEAYGFHYVVEFLEELAASPGEEAAYERAFGLTRRELAERWLDYLRKTAASRSPFEN